jgi:hypothetical protein
MAKLVILWSICIKNFPTGGIHHLPRKAYQFVTVATAAPLVLMGSELISVGYSHGTPSIPIAKAT